MIISSNRLLLLVIVLVFGALALVPAPGAAADSMPVGPEIPRNTFRGITPLKSSSADVARIFGVEINSPDPETTGPVKVDGGEVTFSFLTAGLAKIYRAPSVDVGKVFTIYFKPYSPMNLDEIHLGAAFKKCVDQFDKRYYYFVSDEGVAYQVRSATNQAEFTIYQPKRIETRRLAVNTSCVF